MFFIFKRLLLGAGGDFQKKSSLSKNSFLNLWCEIFIFKSKKLNLLLTVNFLNLRGSMMACTIREKKKKHNGKS